MSEIFKIVLTASLTVIGSVLVYTLGQILSKFIIEPIYEQKKIIAEINDVLIFYANQFFLHKELNPKGEEITNKIRSLSTQLRARTNSIPCYKYFQKHKVVLIKEDIYSACHALIGLSNSVYVSQGQTVNHVESYRDTISSKLKIEI